MKNGSDRSLSFRVHPWVERYATKLGLESPGCCGLINSMLITQSIVSIGKMFSTPRTIANPSIRGSPIVDDYPVLVAMGIVNDQVIRAVERVAMKLATHFQLR